MKILCTLKNALLIIRNRFGLSFATKGLGYLAALLLLLSLLARYKLTCYQTTLLLTISALADITLLKTTRHFLLLLVGFDTLTYRKDYDRSPILVGHQITHEQTGTFAGWLQTRAMHDGDIEDDMYLLSHLPSSNIMTFKGYEIRRAPTKTVVSALMQQPRWERKHIMVT